MLVAAKSVFKLSYNRSIKSTCKLALNRMPAAADGRDLFSKQAEVYAKYRPDYPDEFIEEIVSAAPSRELAWDVGTGTNI